MNTIAISLALLLILSIGILYHHKHRTDDSHRDTSVGIQSSLDASGPSKLPHQNDADPDYKELVQATLAAATDRQEKPVNRFKFAMPSKTVKKAGVKDMDWISFGACPYHDVHRCKVIELMTQYLHTIFKEQ